MPPRPSKPSLAAPKPVRPPAPEAGPPSKLRPARDFRAGNSTRINAFVSAQGRRNQAKRDAR